MTLFDDAIPAVVQWPEPVDQPADDREPPDGHFEQQFAEHHDARADGLTVISDHAQGHRLLALLGRRPGSQWWLPGTNLVAPLSSVNSSSGHIVLTTTGG